MAAMPVITLNEQGRTVADTVRNVDIDGTGATRRRHVNWGVWLSLLNRALVLVAIGLILYAMARYVSETLTRQNIATGFGFLWRPARFQIGETLIAFSPTDTYARALLVALLNTLQVGIIGCLLASVVGVLVGIARLSNNPLLSRLAGLYVEVFRNTPVLLQLFFWYAVMQALPPVRQSISILGAVFISQRGVQMPALSITDPFFLTIALLVLAGIGFWMWLRRPGAEPGYGLLAALVGVPVLLWIVAWGAGLVALSLETPELAGFGFRGGMNLSPEFLALLLGLVVYTAAFIAEIVRGGIEAIPTAQKEAAVSLGFTGGQTLRLVILPQSLRIIVPPLVSEYLSLVKNSSLAVAIGYPDVVWAANTVMNQTGQAIEGVLILTGVYLTLSLTTSFVLNTMNARGRRVSAAGVAQRASGPMPGHGTWLKRFLAAGFGSPVRAVSSVLLIAISALALWAMVNWGVIHAVWTGTGQDCRMLGAGACWAFVGEKWRFFLFGLYPYEEHWRPAIASLIMAVMAAISMVPRFFRPWLPLVWIGGFTSSLWLMAGGYGLAAVSTTAWGGIPVTLLLATSALIIGLPLGILMAVARNSEAPTARMLATIWIEVIRGVPLISVLFLANTLLPLFVPGGGGLDKLLRAQIALTIFASAYLAEAVRAGLRAVPSTQTEASQSLGMTPGMTLRLVVLPQALQTSLPGIINTTIAIFKDTSLITIIGLFDLLGAVRAAGRDPGWLGFDIEGYLFAAVVYFGFCFVMSRYGLWLEKRKPTQKGAKVAAPAPSVAPVVSG
jgi:general L-amino acid transport system permease protein